jgi:hypothetical protein
VCVVILVFFLLFAFFWIAQGSITGAFSPFTDHVTPSFILLAVQGTKVVCYVYELVNGEVEVSKTELVKRVDVDVGHSVSSTHPGLLDSLLK